MDYTATKFSTVADKQHFEEQFKRVERELQSWVFVNGLLEKAEAEAHRVLESQERQELARLQAKYQDAP